MQICTTSLKEPPSCQKREEKTKAEAALLRADMIRSAAAISKQMAEIARAKLLEKHNLLELRLKCQMEDVEERTILEMRVLKD